jgi:homogentisate 1,2-dioxygenase
MWPSFPSTPNTDWLQQRLLAKNGDAASKKGVSIWLFSIDKDMSPRTAFSSLDGDVLIIPQAGTLDIQTELGKMLVRQNEIAVIPRGVRYRVTLPAGPARGYVAELHEGHYRLPDLGAIGSTGLANVRDFQIPKAYFEGKLEGDRAVPTADEDWTVVSRLAGRLWSCTQDHTPFDVAAWHGTNYPVK